MTHITIRGDQMSPKLRREALARFVHRFTKDHVPHWSKSNPACPVQFASDADWLEHTDFTITKQGELHRGVRYCHSTPTWPDNPELRQS